MSALDKIRFVKASAGSGKTHSLMERIGESLSRDASLSADKILATTFTVKAANELEGRIREKLLGMGKTADAQLLSEGLIGTINSVCGRLLGEQAIGAGENPRMVVLPEESADVIFNQATRRVLARHAPVLNPLAERLCIADWRKHVVKIVGAARANGIGAEALADSAEFSVREAERVYVGTVSLTAASLKAEIAKYAKSIDAIASIDEGSVKDVCGMSIWRWCVELKAYDPKTWGDVAHVPKVVWPKREKNPGLLDGVRPLYGTLDAFNPVLSKELRDDVVEFVRGVFSAAKEAMHDYASYKREYGMVDFVDQEAKVLAFLEGEGDFCDYVRDRVREIYVDEFQDTSPIQLAVYLKLHEVVGKSTWVGDPKQSIYRFRGADPAFMQRVIGEIERINEARPEPERLVSTLPYSWRSRRCLVDFANEVFVRTFPDLRPEDVRLGIAEREAGKPGREGGKISAWRVLATSKPGYFSGLADRIARGFKSGEWGRFGDVAVLLRDNDDCETLATELQMRHVPVSRGGAYLRDDKVANLVMCAYRWEFSTRDTLAKAVLDEFVGDPVSPLLECPYAYAPSELLERAITNLRIDDFARGSEGAERALSAIEAMRQLCRSYTEDCRLCGRLATHEGFIRHFMEAKAEGASAEGGDCVQVLTYHAAKGLEWKTVILGTLEEKPTGSPFWTKTVQVGEFDTDRPLAGRAIRYLPAPFGDRRQNEASAFVGRGIDGFEAMHAEELAAEIEESRRLMYVGVTRAIDSVVFAAYWKVSKKGEVDEGCTAWLDALTENPLFKGSFNMPAGDVQWPIGEKPFDVMIEEFAAPDEPSVLEEPKRQTDAIIPRRDYADAKVSPSSLEGTGNEAVVAETSDLGGKLKTTGELCADLGECVHAYLAVAVPGGDDATLAESLIRNWGQKGTVSAASVVEAGSRLRDWIRGRWKDAAIRTEVPMSFVNDVGQRSEGYVDMIAETSDGCVIIDHKIVKDDEPSVYVKRYANQVDLYRQALMATGVKVIGAYLHLVRQGVCVGISNEV